MALSIPPGEKGFFSHPGEAKKLGQGWEPGLNEANGS